MFQSFMYPLLIGLAIGFIIGLATDSDKRR